METKSWIEARKHTNLSNSLIPSFSPSLKSFRKHLRSISGRPPCSKSLLHQTCLSQHEELPATTTYIMSVSCSDCFSDLLCCEESDEIFPAGDEEVEYYSSDLEYKQQQAAADEDVEEWIGELIEHEIDYVPGIDYLTRFQSHSLDASARAESIAWILKVQRYYGFQPLTAYLAVNYFDRFLYSRPLPETRGWPLQLLSVASLSLAAKMEEPLVPSLLDLQVEGPKYIFEPKTINRMEFLVLSTLDWRLRSITPFSFITFFAYKVDPSSLYNGFLISRASQIILSHIQEASFLEYRPSCIAAATIICAARDLPILSCVNGQYDSWCYGLHKDQVTSCHEFVLQQTTENEKSKKTPKLLPQLRVVSRVSNESSSSSFSISSSSSSCSSSSSSSSSKRRRLNKNLWTDDDKGSSE